MAAVTKEQTNGQKVDEEADSSGVQTFQLRRLSSQSFTIPISGTAPLIVHRWSEKAKRQMLDAQTTKARAKKEPRDPYAEFESSRYRLPDGRDGFPATAFKAAIVHAARLFDRSLTQTIMKQTVRVTGEGPEQLVPIIGEATSREDTVRLSRAGSDLRYRAQFWPWSATLEVVTVEGQFDRDSIVALVDAAGIGGVGEWRPTAPNSPTGTYGTFEVISE